MPHIEFPEKINRTAQQRGSAIVAVGCATGDQDDAGAALCQRQRSREARRPTPDNGGVEGCGFFAHAGHLTFLAAISSPRQCNWVGQRPIAASFGVQSRTIPDSSRRPMDQTDQHEFPPATPAKRAAAFLVHVLTALGAGVALLALLEAVHEHWAAMFWWLGAALVIDGVD